LGFKGLTLLFLDR